MRVLAVAALTALIATFHYSSTLWGLGYIQGAAGSAVGLVLSRSMATIS